MIESFRRLMSSILPRTRRPVTVLTLSPLVLFLAIFAAVAIGLEYWHVVSYSRPWWFAAMVLTPWLWWMWVAGNDGLPRFRSLLALQMRLALFGLLVVTLAEPWSLRENKHLAVVYAVDLSGSVSSEATDEALRFVARVGGAEKPIDDLAGLVYFGREAAVQLPPRPHVSPAELQSIDVRVERDGSNAARALSLSAALLPDNQNGRIVLVSDGVMTEGPLAETLGELKSRGIAVDVLPVGYSYEEEVWVERLDLPRVVMEGQTYEASVVVASLQPGRGQLVLLENGKQILEQDVEYAAGKSRFSIPFHLREPGYYEYTARLIPETGDHVQQNNVAIGSLFLEGRGRILVVTDSTGDPRDWQPLVEALKAVELDAQVVSAYDLPDNSQVLKTYDSVIFVNVERNLFDVVQMKALHDAIHDDGVGFLMVGGEHSFGPGGWGGTPIAEALPVEMDITQRKVLMNGALVLVIDHSGSMGQPVPPGSTSKQVIANRGAVAAMSTLGAKDWVGVVSFDSTATWVVPFALNASPDDAARKVRGIGTGGGTDMYPGLFQALEALEKLPPGEVAQRHIILLTDGQSQPGDIRGFVTRCREAKISVSTVGVGKPDEIDGQVLSIIAAETQGRFYPVPDANQLPRVLMREAITLRKNAIRNQPFQPGFEMASPIIKGIDGLPELQGMVVTVPKTRAEVVLVAPTGDEAEPLDPLLALHRHGVGRTAAFTSDLSTNWGREWLNWPQYRPFVRQLMTEIARTSGDNQLQIRTEVSGTEAIIQIEDHSPELELREVRGLLHGPDNHPLPLELKQVAPRRYQARVPLSGEGRYLVTALGSENERATDGFVVPYSQEYLRFTSNHKNLQDIAEATGGRVLSGRETGTDIYSPTRSPRQTSQSVVVLCLQLLALLIPLDVGLRRIQFDVAGLRSLFTRRRAPSTATMSTLLRRKESLATTEPEKPVRPLATTTTSPLPTPTRQPAMKTSAPPPPPKPVTNVDAPTTTTARLLALKRNRDTGNESS